MGGQKNLLPFLIKENRLKYIIDKRDRVIAQRPSTKAALRVSVQGNWKARIKVNNHLKPKRLSAETKTKAYNHLKSLKIVD